jgi:hypothetical protein
MMTEWMHRSTFRWPSWRTMRKGYLKISITYRQVKEYWTNVRCQSPALIPNQMVITLGTWRREFFPWRYSPNLGLGLPPWNSPFHLGFLDLSQLVGLLGRVISSSQGLYLYTNTEERTHTQTLNIHALSGIGTRDPGFRASEDSA